ncbi:Uncharacterised protein [Dorea longicatena]|nr:Uncharacterised protein [Dorea longicatena]
MIFIEIHMGNNSCNRLALPVISGEYKTFPVIGKKMFNMIILKKFFDFFPVIINSPIAYRQKRDKIFSRDKGFIQLNDLL